MSKPRSFLYCLAPRGMSLALLFVLLMPALSAHADRITMRGTSIPLPDSRIERIVGGYVHHVDSQGRPRAIELHNIAAISFDRLPELDEAEGAFAEGNHEKAVLRFLQALLKADTNEQRIWVRSRLVRVHDAMEQYPEAASHLASILLMEEHPFWRGYEPLREPADPSYASVVEALDRLREAQRASRHPNVLAMVRRIIDKLEPIQRKLNETHDAEAIQPGRTVSGYEIDQIRRGKLVRPVTATPQQKNGAEAELSEENLDPKSPAGIEAMLRREQWRSAVETCRNVAQDPGDRDLAEFLHQYGRALAGVGEHEDAAVMFTRCTILFPGTSQALASLIETAIIYRDGFGNAATAKRLLERAARESERRGDRTAVDRAKRLLSELTEQDS